MLKNRSNLRYIKNYFSVIENKFNEYSIKVYSDLNSIIQEFITNSIIIFALLDKIKPINKNIFIEFSNDPSSLLDYFPKQLINLTEIDTLIDNSTYKIQNKLNKLLFSENFSNYKNYNELIENLEFIPIINFLGYLNINNFNRELNLGFIYEMFLNNQERKIKGSYYTPEFITSYMTSEVINFYLSNDLNNINKFIDNLSPEELVKILGKLETLMILDPSVGTGHFIIESIDKIISIYQRIRLKVLNNTIFESISKKRSYLFIEDNSKFVDYLLINFIIPNNIYGVDIDKNGTKITKCRILLKLSDITNFSPDSIRLINILQGNSLIGEISLDNSKYMDDIRREYSNYFDWYDKFKYVFTEKNGFDIVIGNPPFINSKELNKDYKNIFKKLKSSKISRNFFTVIKGQYDLYSLFIERSYNLLGDKGIISLIVPDSLIDRSNFTLIRKFMLNHLIILKFITLSDVFDDPSVSNVIFLASKDKIESDYNIGFCSINSKNEFDQEIMKVNYTPKSKINKLPNSILKHFQPIELKIIMNLLKKSKLSAYLSVKRGEEIGKNQLSLTKTNIIRQKIVTGSNIRKYRINGHSYINRSNVQKRFDIYSSPKLIIRQLGDFISCSMDYSDSFITLQSLYNLKHLEGKENIPLQFFTAIINSNLLGWFDMKLFRGKVMFSRILLENILNLPIVLPESYEPYIYLVNLLHILNRQENISKSNIKLAKYIDKDILDILVFENYFNENKKNFGLFNLLKRKIKRISGYSTSNIYDIGFNNFYVSLVKEFTLCMQNKEFQDNIDSIKNIESVNYILN